MSAYITAWQCIGCGKIDAPAPCLGVCEDRKIELAYAADHKLALATVERLRHEGAVLAALVRELACTTPHQGHWERSYRMLQDRARRILAEMGGAPEVPDKQELVSVDQS
jgi:hypothetical protein